MQIVPISPAAWRLAREAIAEGHLVVFPTDTVYGLACDPHNPAAIAPPSAINPKLGKYTQWSHTNEYLIPYTFMNPNTGNNVPA